MRRPPAGMLSFSCSRIPLTFWVAAVVRLIIGYSLPIDREPRGGLPAPSPALGVALAAMNHRSSNESAAKAVRRTRCFEVPRAVECRAHDPAVLFPTPGYA